MTTIHSLSNHQKKWYRSKVCTLAKVGYMGDNFPLEFAFFLRMREKVIKKVLVEGQETAFETFGDNCSTFLYIPMSMKKEGVLNLKIIHEPFQKTF